MISAVSKAALPIEFADARFLPILAQLSLVIAMHGPDLTLLLLKVFGERVIDMSQLMLAMRKGAQRAQRTLLSFFKVTAKRRLVFLIIHLDFLLLFVGNSMFTWRRFYTHSYWDEIWHGWCDWRLVRKHGCEERRLIAVLDFTSLSVEYRHGQHGEHDRHELGLLLLEVFVRMLAFGCRSHT